MTFVKVKFKRSKLLLFSFPTIVLNYFQSCLVILQQNMNLQAKSTDILTVIIYWFIYIIIIIIIFFYLMDLVDY